MPVSRLAPGAFAGVLVFGLAWFDGGFYAPAWGVVSLGLLGVCGCAIVLSERLYLSRLALASVGGLFGLAAWTLMSGLWTSDLTKTVSDAELAFVYPIALTASLLVARRTGTSSLAIGTLVAMVAVCLYALGGRLAPDVFGFPNNVDAAGRLYSPIGYWNGLGGFAAMAALLGGGLAAARLPTAVRVGASASLVVTLVTLYLTFSRGALIAAAVGLVVLAVASPARLWLAATLTAALPWAAAAVLVVERRSQLTATTLDRQAVIDQGHGAIPLLIGCAAGAAATTLALTVLAPRVRVGATARRIIGAVLIVAIVLACAVAVERRGGPVEMVRSVRNSLEAQPQAINANNANRLRDLSLNGRLDQWRVAWHMFTAHPLAGEGAGGWEAQWLLHEPYNDYNQRPHSLYLETLAELGLIGAVLLAFALVPPLAAFARARHHPAASATLAAFVVFLVHASRGLGLAVAGSRCRCTALRSVPARGARGDSRDPDQRPSALDLGRRDGCARGLRCGRSAGQPTGRGRGLQRRARVGMHQRSRMRTVPERGCPGHTSRIPGQEKPNCRLGTDLRPPPPSAKHSATTSATGGYG